MNSCPPDLVMLQGAQVAPVVLPDPSFPLSPLTSHYLLQESSSHCYKQTKKYQLFLRGIAHVYYAYSIYYSCYSWQVF